MAPRQPPRKRGTPAPQALQPLPGLPVQPEPHPIPPTPMTNLSPQSHNTYTDGANYALQKIKLEVYNGATDITPWLTKADLMVNIYKLDDDQAKIAYIHLHLAGEALAWFNNRGLKHSSSFQNLITAMEKHFGLTDTKRQQ